MPLPTSNQGAQSKRWLVPLLATSTTRRSDSTPIRSERAGFPATAGSRLNVRIGGWTLTSACVVAVWRRSG